MSHPCTVYAADTEEYYAVRIRLFSEFLKLRLQDMEVDGPLKSVEVPNLTGFVDARGADASGSADVRETGANGGQLEDHKEVAGELTDARQSDIGKKARSALGSDEIAQWAASATICPGLPNGDSLDAPLNNDMMENGHELSQTQSDYTLSAPEDVKPLL
ncbi:hypothetical protein BD410DRAFT_360205 [Rickenella mellea]|uniref:Uncharacterized protein n=1 Tax=Rickenella mellea TaxID=50990 RepID=A0A4Y7Q227_9AGAM|nr:hypothetical protein BD410DRAFT_360205 [Rickenella mellea]